MKMSISAILLLLLFSFQSLADCPHYSWAATRMRVIDSCDFQSIPSEIRHGFGVTWFLVKGTTKTGKDARDQFGNLSKSCKIGDFFNKQIFEERFSTSQQISKADIDYKTFEKVEHYDYCSDTGGSITCATACVYTYEEIAF